MNLTVRDAAQLLSVSEKTIYRWIARQKLPTARIGDQYRFNRAELLEWATANQVRVSPALFSEDSREPAPSLCESLNAGGIFYRVDGDNKESVLAEVVRIMPLPPEVDKGYMLEVLLARESLGSTGFGDGIALPHARTPIVMHIPRPMVSLCFLEKPVDFGAIDKKPIHTLFVIASPTIRGHLGILSRISFALRDTGFQKILGERPLRDVIFSAAGRIDQLISNLESS
ncbi:MAG: PTS sugar transporter subunit IIA [Proteobacteria bacterium]|nr:PTS sugar transporter subunit IIA [Pseudomonadota bacterium]